MPPRAFSRQPINWELAVERYRLKAIARREQALEDRRAEYSRREVRDLVQYYHELGGATPGDGILPPQRSADWALARVIEARADLDLALEALARWEAIHEPRLPRWRCLVLGLMEGRHFSATAAVVGIGNRNGEVRRFMEEGLEFLYDYLRGRRLWTDGIGLPRLDPYELQSYGHVGRGTETPQSSGRARDPSWVGDRGRRGPGPADTDHRHQRPGDRRSAP